MKRYIKYVRANLLYFIVGPVLMLTEVLGEVMLPYLMNLTIKHIESEGANSSYVVMIGLVMIGTAAIMLAGGVGGNYFSAKASAGFAAGLRKDVYCKIQEFSFANIDHFSTGSLVTRLTNDITQFQNVIRMALVMLLRAPGMLIGALIMALTINLRLAVIIAVVIPLLAAALYILIRIAYPRFEKMQTKIDRVNSALQENLVNVRVVKSFVRGTHEIGKFAKANQDLKDTSMGAFKVIIFNMPLMALAMNITTLAVVWFGGKQIIVGTMDVAELTAFTTYIIQILMSLMMLAMILLQSSRAVASARRISEVLEEPIDLNDTAAANKELEVRRGKVEFRNVSFQYYKKRDEKVLEDINITVQPGQLIGIIGSTGSGKTSLVQLIPRLYDATAGEVLVDDINVKDYSLRKLREGVGMVLQKNVLFSGTISDNLKWGNKQADEKEIRAAAGHAQADGFVMNFGEGYHTELGQGGVNVSGGQKQRLCIARALLKKPKILILDDSTSAVDTATEARIRECFQKELKSTTKFVIAQRISSVKDADQILVLDEGKIVGYGTHEELLAGCEAYQEIYYSQMDKKEVTA